MNKYLDKIASYYDEEHEDPYTSRLMERLDKVHRGNRLLVRRGYEPAIPETSVGELEADKLTNLEDRANTRPVRRSIAAASTLGGLVAGAIGAGAGGAVSHAILGRAHPAAMLVGGLGTGLATGIGSYRLAYNEKRREMDDQYQRTHNDYLDKALSRYQKQD